MSRLFISHASADNAAAVALRIWLRERGYEDVFLDIDPKRGLERWQEALKKAAHRCEAVLCLVSPAWLASRWCLGEFLAAKLLHKPIFGLIVAAVSINELPPELSADWQLCELAGEDRFRAFDIEVLGKAAHVRFRETGLELLRRGLDRAGLDASSFPWPPAEEPGRIPYRGLKAMEPQDAAVFFGRDAWIVRGLDRIRGLISDGVDNLLVVLGASGSGKSSFLRAGLWPRLLRDDTHFLPLPIIRPQASVISGSSGLAVSLAGAFDRLGRRRAPGEIRDLLGDGRPAFARLLDELCGLARNGLGGSGEAANPVIVLSLDQAEELFDPDGEAEAARFLDLLVDVLRPPPGHLSARVVVIATMRSDRYELMQTESRLAGIGCVLFDLPPISRGEFKTVIEGPARCLRDTGARLEIEPALTEQLVADADGADALPLLSFTLERLYADYGAAGRLTLAQYKRLGGVQGSIEAAVAAALAQPGRSPPIPPGRIEQDAGLRAAFLPWLARVDPASGAPLRRVATRAEIPKGSLNLVDRLVEARLVVADRRGGADVIEIAHESLLRQWPMLTAWLNADAVDLMLVEGVERAATEWDRNGRLDAWLAHGGDRLALLAGLADRGTLQFQLGVAATAYLNVCRDRERKRAAELEAVNRQRDREADARREAENVIRQAQKLESVSQITGGIAHDVGNLVTAIHGCLEIFLRRASNLDPKLMSYVTNADKAAQRCLELVAKLGAFSRRQALASQPVNLNIFIGERLDLIRHTAGASITVQTKLGPDPWPALVDPQSTEASLLNLVCNARDAMPQGGTILLETANATLSGSDPETELLAGDYVVLSLADTGTGIPEQVRDRIFEPFFTTKELGQGAGLGLSMVYGLMKQLGGAVRVNPNVDHGTRVALYFQRVVAQYRPR